MTRSRSRLIHEATEAGMWSDHRRMDAFRELVELLRRITRTFEPDDHHLEVVAKAARRAGAVRMAIREHQGCADYAHAIELYEAMSAKNPERSGIGPSLISTLLEYCKLSRAARRLRSGSARRRHSYEVAEGLLIDKLATLPCFRKAVIPEFKALVKMLSDGRDAAADPTLANRLTTWLKENR